MTDLGKLGEINCSNIKKVKPLSKQGGDFLDFFTLVARLDTKSKKGMSFYDFWEKKSEYMKKGYIQKMIKYYKDTEPSYPLIKIWWGIFRLYMGSVNLFRPTVAMNVYCKFKPTHILDPTMGWGGRLLGACILDIPNYTGFDLNKDLEQPYKKMIAELKPITKTNIDVRFIDALKVDYSKINYDMVFTSPPYYNVEIYEGSVAKSKDDWDEQFYKPLFDKTWTHLKKGGHFCLNVPEEVYKRVLVKMLGRPKYFLPLPKTKRTAGEKYKEFIYVWIK